jgi:uncharacterized membrane protein YqjE
MTTATESPRDEGLTGSLRRLARTLLDMIQTRLEILGTELSEERFNLTRLAVVVLAAQFCLQAGLMLGVLFVVLAVSPENRLAAIGIAALALLLAAAIAALWLRAWLKSRPPMFGATIAELRKDRDRLKDAL